MKILIAEDDRISRNFLQKFMQTYGEVDVAVDGMEAVDLYMDSIKNNSPYDLLCLDIMMPKVDGLKVYADIAQPDSLRTGSRFYVFPDGTHLYGHNGNETVYGEFYLIENGNLRPVAAEGQCVGLPVV